MALPPATAGLPCLQDYSLRKHLERWWKAPLLGSERVSVADPEHYSHRFLAAMQAVLLEGGSGGGVALSAGSGGGRTEPA